MAARAKNASSKRIDPRSFSINSAYRKSCVGHTEADRRNRQTWHGLESVRNRRGDSSEPDERAGDLRERKERRGIPKRSKMPSDSSAAPTAHAGRADAGFDCVAILALAFGSADYLDCKRDSGIEVSPAGRAGSRAMRRLDAHLRKQLT